MSGFSSFLKKAGKCWLHSWRGDPFEPSEAIIKTIRPSGGTSGLFSMLNSILSAGAAGFTLVTMLVTTVLGVVPVVFDTVVDPDSPLSLQASQEVRANLRVEGFGGPDGTGPALLGGASGGESFLGQMAAFHNTVDVVAELRLNDIDIPIEELAEILAAFEAGEITEFSELIQEIAAVAAQIEQREYQEAEPAPSLVRVSTVNEDEETRGYTTHTGLFSQPENEAYEPEPAPQIVALAETEEEIEAEAEIETDEEEEIEEAVETEVELEIEEEVEIEEEPETEEEPELEIEPEIEEEPEEEPEPAPAPQPTSRPEPTPEPIYISTPQPQEPLLVVVPGADMVDDTTFAIVFGDTPFALMVDGGSGTGAVTFEVTRGHNVVSVARYTGVVTVENSGTAVITITKAGNPTGFAPARKDITLYIARRDLSNVSINITSDHIYDGTAQTPTFTVTDGSNNIAVTADFTADFSNNINAGDTALITLTATADGNYTGTATAYFTIARAPGENAPDFAVPTGLYAVYGDTLDDVDLAGGWEWYAPGDTPVGGAGTREHSAIFTPASVNFYPAQMYLTIEVALMQQPALTITIADPDTLTFGNAFAVLETDGGSVGAVTWQLIYGDAVSIAPTTGIITIERAGTFRVRATREGDANHAPVSAEITLSIARRYMPAHINVSVPGTFIYTGAAQTPTPIVTDGSGNLITAADFDVDWSNNTNAGTATVTVTATDSGNYTGYVEATFAIARATVTITGFNITRAFISGNNAVTAWGNLQFAGLVAGQTAYVSTANVTGTFAQPYAATHSVSFTGEFEMTGGTTNPDNYVITQPTGLTGTITPATGNFGNPDAVTVTFAPGLTLAGVTPPAYYTWANTATTLTVAQSNNQFPAIFNDPSGNFNPAYGYITVIITQALGTTAPDYITPANLGAIYGSTLSTVALPDGWTWDDSASFVGNYGNREHPATFIPDDDNFAIVERYLTVAVSRANQTGFAITEPAADIVFGDTSVSLTTTGGQGNGTVTWEVTSGTTVVSINASGAITILSAGNATITATRSGGTNHNEITATLDITVERRNITGGTVTVGDFAAMTFNNTAQTPAADVTIGTLTATGTWSNVTNVADTTTFTADGNFIGTIEDVNPNMTPATITNINATDSEVVSGNPLYGSKITATVTGVCGTIINGTWAWVNGAQPVNATGDFAATFTHANDNHASPVTHNINVTATPHTASVTTNGTTTNFASLTDAINSIITTAGNHTVRLYENQSLAPMAITTGGVHITLVGYGTTERQITLSQNGTMFNIGVESGTNNNISLTLGNNITLVGRRAGGNGNVNNNNSVVRARSGARFTMLDGSEITGNHSTATGDAAGRGAAVHVTAGGIFTMEGGEITGNSANVPPAAVGGATFHYTAGGLFLLDGTANLRGGAIRNNTGLSGDIFIAGGYTPTTTLSGGFGAGEITLNAVDDTRRPQLTIDPSWMGSVDLLNLRATIPDIPTVIQRWRNQTVASGITAAQISNITLGEFVTHTAANPRQNISPEYFIDTDGSLQAIAATVTTGATTTNFPSLAAALGSITSGTHIVTLMADQTIAPTTLPAANITLVGSGAHTITLSEDGSMFTIPAGSTFNLGNNITLQGRANTASLVRVDDGGVFNMSGGRITGNSTGVGGGVCVAGTFNMSGGQIDTNHGFHVGGVHVNTGGTFNMRGGLILNNNAGYDGGGVGISAGGTFRISDGTIFGTDAADNYSNTASVVGAALSGTAQFGTFDANGVFTPRGNGNLHTTNNTIEVANGAVIRPTGSGTQADPWLIRNEADLRAVGRGARSGYGYWGVTQHYRMIVDIDLTGGDNWTAIWGFNGVFDGNGHIITGLNMPSLSGGHGGMFSSISRYGTVRNLGLVNANVVGSGSGNDLVGGIAGWSRGLIENSFVTGNIQGNNYVGGIAGWVGGPGPGIYGDGVVRNTWSTATITGNTNVGGIAGYIVGGAIVRNSVGLNPIINSNGERGRVVGNNNGSYMSVLYARNCMTIGPAGAGALNEGSGNRDGFGIGHAQINCATHWRYFYFGSINGTATPQYRLNDAEWAIVSRHVPPEWPSPGIWQFSLPITLSSNLGGDFAGIVPHGQSPAGLLSQAEAALEALTAPAAFSFTPFGIEPFGIEPFGIEPFGIEASTQPPTLDDIAAFLPTLETQATAAPGETVTILALPAPGYIFSHWQNAYGQIISLYPELTFTIQPRHSRYDLTLTAIYIPDLFSPFSSLLPHAILPDEPDYNYPPDDDDDDDDDDPDNPLNPDNPQALPKEEDDEPIFDDGFDPDPDPDLETDYEPLSPQELTDIANDVQSLNNLVSGNHD